MTCNGTAKCTCGCCAGTSVQTPVARVQPSGLGSLSYRVGTWSSFNQSMLARLSSADYPALAPLKTRDTDDFSIALLDASAVVLDVLSFYQERLANEGYLRTAGQARSLTELSRLIGYQPSPGVAASAYLAFTLKAAPGQTPDPTSTSITIPAGTQVQSVPPPGQSAQTFETAADVQATPDWNALAVQTSVPWLAPGNLATGSSTPGPGGVYLSGTATQLKVGDSLLILGVGRETWSSSSGTSPSPDWGVVVLNRVCVDPVRNLTYAAWNAPLPVAVSDASSSSAVPSPPSGLSANVDRVATATAMAAPLPTSRLAIEGGGFAGEVSGGSSSGTAPGSFQGDLVSGNLFSKSVSDAYSADFAADRDNLYGELYYEGPPPLIGMMAVPDTAFASAPWGSAKVFAFRQKGALYGHNAPNPNLFVNATGAPLPNGLITASSPSDGQTTPFHWKAFQIPSATQIDLDATYPKAVVGSWFALVASGAAQLYGVAGAQTISRNDFALSAKVTELTPDYSTDPLLPSQSLASQAGAFGLQQTEVWLESEQLTVALQPLTYPLYGNLIDLQALRPDLVGLQVIAVSGKRQKIKVLSGVTGLSFTPDDGTQAVIVNPGDVFTLIDATSLPPPVNLTFTDWTQDTTPIALDVEDSNGRTGQIAASATGAQASLSQFELTPSSASDPIMSEYALVYIAQGTPVPYAHTQIQLNSALTNCYERATTTVNANVALATNGQSVSEIVGSGNSSLADQSFTLKQSPLTYTQAPTSTGSESTLEVLANGIAWSEVASLYGASPSAQVFEVLNQADGSADVLFGDGEEGALLPTGQANVIANYRIGLGASGNVTANSITTLIDRPLGVSAVTNPQAATGGQDPESIEDTRTSAPLSVLTLGRVVSVIDYENFARGFAGIAKANGTWIPSGANRGVYVTVAGINGVALPAGNPTLANLTAALQDFGNPLTPVTVQSFVETLFGFAANVKYDPTYQQPAVTTAIQQMLATTFGFAQRDFGQGVSMDEIASAIQGVPGVIAVNIVPGSLQVQASSLAGHLANPAGGLSVAIWKNWVRQSIFVPRPMAPRNAIVAYTPLPNAQFVPLPGEILVIDPDPSAVTLGVMS